MIFRPKYHYKDKVIQVMPGLDGKSYFTGWRTESGGSHRLVSPNLPVRECPLMALGDLVKWAKKKRLLEVVL